MPTERTLTDAQKQAIIDRRGHRSDGDGKVHRKLVGYLGTRISELENNQDI